MIKRYTIIGLEEYTLNTDHEESNDGNYCRYSDVEKLIELNKEMLFALKEILICEGCCNCDIECTENFCCYYKAKIAIQKVEQFNGGTK